MFISTELCKLDCLQMWTIDIIDENDQKYFAVSN